MLIGIDASRANRAKKTGEEKRNSRKWMLVSKPLAKKLKKLLNY